MLLPFSEHGESGLLLYQFFPSRDSQTRSDTAQAWLQSVLMTHGLEDPTFVQSGSKGETDDASKFSERVRPRLTVRPAL